MSDEAAPDITTEASTESQTTNGFRFGLPQLRLRMPERSTSVLSQPLNRQHMLLVERFFLLRTLLITMGMEGEDRYIRSLSHDMWLQVIKDHGFVHSGVMPTLASYLCDVGEGYQN